MKRVYEMVSVTVSPNGWLSLAKTFNVFVLSDAVFVRSFRLSVSECWFYYVSVCPCLLSVAVSAVLVPVCLSVSADLYI